MGVREETMGTLKRSISHPICGVLKACFSGGKSYDYDYLEYSGNGRRVFASDEDREHWVAEPGIDRKASDFIARYHAKRVTDSQCQFVS